MKMEIAPDLPCEGNIEEFLSSDSGNLASYNNFPVGEGKIGSGTIKNQIAAQNEDI